MAQFQSMQVKKVTAKKQPIDKTAKIQSLLEKHRLIYNAVNDLIKSGKKKSHAHMQVALDQSTSQGAVAFYCTAYHVYLKYPAITAAVDAGTYPLSSLCKDATKSDRSAIISEKLGIEIVVTLD